jgi:hypothetical protein
MVLNDVELVDDAGNVTPVVRVEIDSATLRYDGMSGHPVTAPTPATIRSRLFSTLTIRRCGDGKALGAFVFTGLGTALASVPDTVICGVQLVDPP